MTLDLLFLSLIYRAQRGSLAIPSPPSEERVLSPRLTDSKDKLFEWGMIILLCLLYYIIPSVYNFSNLFAPGVCGFLSWKVFHVQKFSCVLPDSSFLSKQGKVEQNVQDLYNHVLLRCGSDTVTVNYLLFYTSIFILVFLISFLLFYFDCVFPHNVINLSLHVYLPLSYLFSKPEMYDWLGKESYLKQCSLHCKIEQCVWGQL